MRRDGLVEESDRARIIDLLDARRRHARDEIELLGSGRADFRARRRHSDESERSILLEGPVVGMAEREAEMVLVDLALLEEPRLSRSLPVAVTRIALLPSLAADLREQVRR